MTTKKFSSSSFVLSSVSVVSELVLSILMFVVFLLPSSVGVALNFYPLFPSFCNTPLEFNKIIKL